MSFDKEKIAESVQRFMHNIFNVIENGKNQEEIQKAINEMTKEFIEYNVKPKKNEKSENSETNQETNNDKQENGDIV